MARKRLMRLTVLAALYNYNLVCILGFIFLTHLLMSVSNKNIFRSAIIILGYLFTISQKLFPITCNLSLIFFRQLILYANINIYEYSEASNQIYLPLSIPFIVLSLYPHTLIKLIFPFFGNDNTSNDCIFDNYLLYGSHNKKLCSGKLEKAHTQNYWKPCVSIEIDYPIYLEILHFKSQIRMLCKS